MAYVFQEYPKWLFPEGKPAVLVENEAAELLFNEQNDGDPSGADDDRDALYDQAAALGLKIDKRWSSTRLKSMIAEETPAAKPVEPEPEPVPAPEPVPEIVPEAAV